VTVVRNDTGVFEGGEISIYYDPMIAKLVTHAPTREAAIDAQANALDAFVIDGIRHNIPFLSALMQHPRWRPAASRPASSPRSFPKASGRPAPEGEIALRMAAIAIACDHGSTPASAMSLRRWRAGARSPSTAPGSCCSAASVSRGGHRAKRGGRRSGLCRPEPHRRLERLAAGRSRSGAARSTASRSRRRSARSSNGVALGHAGAYRHHAHVYTPREAELAALMPEKVAADTGKKLLCPMPGLVKAIARLRRPGGQGGRGALPWSRR
jgi:propionyl-CoA carboxylase alpha chain